MHNFVPIIYLVTHGCHVIRLNPCFSISGLGAIFCVCCCYEMNLSLTIELMPCMRNFRTPGSTDVQTMLPHKAVMRVEVSKDAAAGFGTSVISEMGRP